LNIHYIMDFFVCQEFCSEMTWLDKLLFSGASTAGGVAALGSPSGGAVTAERR
jgi:hypothetical protein